MYKEIPIKHHQTTFTGLVVKLCPAGLCKALPTKAYSDFKAGCALDRDWARQPLLTLFIVRFYVLFIGIADFLVSFLCSPAAQATVSVITLVQHLL